MVTAAKRVAVLSSCLLGIVLAAALMQRIQAHASTWSERGVGMQDRTREPSYAALNAIPITLTPGLATSFVYTDLQGLPVQLDFPPDAVDQMTVIGFVPDMTLEADHPGFVLVGHAFYLIASRDGHLVPGLLFLAPVAVTLQYSDTDLQGGLDERWLTMYGWTGCGWRDAVQSCDPNSTYDRDPENDVIRFAICATGQYGLFSTHPIYLPLVSAWRPTASTRFTQQASQIKIW